MAEIIRKTECTFFGPWLLDSAALAALDEIIDEQWARLEVHKKIRIAKAVRRNRSRLRKSDSEPERSDGESTVEDKEIQRRAANDYPDDGCMITLTLSSGNRVRVKRFREAVNDVHCQDQEVAKIEVRLCCGGIRGDLVVPTPDNNHGLSLVTLPEASEQADELFVRLHRWSDQHKPAWIRRVRSSSRDTIPLGPVLAGLLILVMGASGILTGAISVKNTVKDKIRELVAKGVKPEDQGRALELLLRQSAGIPNAGEAIILPTWFYVGVAVVVVAAVFLCYPAHTAFEIGKGVASVRRQKSYDSFLSKKLPAFLIMGVLASILGSFAFGLLRSK